MAFNIKKTVIDFLGAASQDLIDENNKHISKLQKTVDTQNEILNAMEAVYKTDPSALALETKDNETTQGSGIRVNPVKLQQLYFNNQYIFRATNVRANELITRGFRIFDGDEEGLKKCTELIENSGNSAFFKQWSVNTDVWGSGWIEKNYSKDGAEIKKLSFIHPATFGWKTLSKNSYVIDIGADKQPVGCQQKTIDENGAEIVNYINKDKIELLTFNKIADEFIGVGIVQPIYNTITRLMNMEGAAANAAVKAANPVWVGIFDTVSEHTVRKWSYLLGRLATKEQIFLPKGTDIQLVSPEKQLFSEYSEYYVDSVIAGTGVPKSLLLGRSGDTNRAESVVHSRHFQSLIEANQDSMEYVINRIFKEYGRIANFEPPTFKFNEIAENADLMADKAVTLFTAGIISREMALEMLGIEEAAEGGTFNTPKKSLNDAIKEDDAKTFHPAKPGSPQGSQKGNKKAAKKDIANVSSPK